MWGKILSSREYLHPLLVISFTKRPNNRDLSQGLRFYFRRAPSFYNAYANACFCDDWVNQFFLASSTNRFLIPRYFRWENSPRARVNTRNFIFPCVFLGPENGAEINGWDKPLFDFRDGRGSSESGEPCDTFTHTCEAICMCRRYLCAKRVVVNDYGREAT